jgi:hypothetical protein
MEEIFKDVINYEGIYKISNKGNLISLDRFVINGGNGPKFRKIKGQKIKTTKDSYGYETCVLSKNGKPKTHRIHSLVYNSFKKPLKKGFVIDHIDNNPSNNILENLQSMSHRQNISKGMMLKRKDKLSKYPNVSFRRDRKKWFSRIQVNNKMKIIGHFDNELDAYNAFLNYKKQNKIL